MAADSNVTLDHAVIEASRRTYRDLWPVPVRGPVDKARVLAHLRGLLAELQAQEVEHADT